MRGGENGYKRAHIKNDQKGVRTCAYHTRGGGGEMGTNERIWLWGGGGWSKNRQIRVHINEMICDKVGVAGTFH